MTIHDSEGIGKLWTLLKHARLELDAEEMADLLWLATQMGEVDKTPAQELPVEETETKTIKTVTDKTPPLPPTPPPAIPEPVQPQASVNVPNESDDKSGSKPASKTLPFKAPAAPGLRNKLALRRELRPLMRKVASRTQQILDEEKTVNQFAENKILIPQFKPAPERWLDLALVVEKSASIIIWQEIIAEFQQLIELSGAFRSVSTWNLQTDEKGEIKLFTQQNKSIGKQRSRSHKELLDSAGRRLILLVSDCTSPIWYPNQNHNQNHNKNRNIYDILKLWSNSGPVAIVQLFPEKLWTRTAMGFGYPVLLNALVPGVPNNKLNLEGLPVWEEVDVNKGINLPVITLEPDSVKQWSRVVAGIGSTQTAGILFQPALIPDPSEISTRDTNNTKNKLSTKDLVNRFRATASPTARRLAGLMATVPVSLPVVHLIQQTVLKESMQVHVAEVFMSGILKPQNLPTDNPITVIATQGSNRKHLTSPNYDFVEGVRDLLIESVPTPDVEKVLHQVSQYIADKVGISIKDFAALLSPDDEWDEKTKEKVKQDINIQSFAKIATDTLYRLGGEYAEFADYLEKKAENSRNTPSTDKPSDDTSDEFPPLEDFNFEIANVVIDQSAVDIQPFEFEVATIELKIKESNFLQRMLRRNTDNTELIINRRRQQANGFSENLGDETALEMVQIPGGTFTMGAPETEEGSEDSERPQHQVTVPDFFMGKYPVTQAQWKFVASLEQVNRQLKADPSEFKGDNRPVKQVNWFDAVEFCQRLSQYTNRNYRLPSEAEWEYACRAGTKTPFHFGETITTNLANYRGTDNEEYKWSGSYGRGIKGIYREETTEVGSFGVANGFGLYDMHGNVWEWCADQYHNNYEKAPTDGSAWIKDDSDNDNHSRLVRGGSWDYNPEHCRSAYRVDILPDIGLNSFGFRLVCGVRGLL